MSTDSLNSSEDESIKPAPKKHIAIELLISDKLPRLFEENRTGNFYEYDEDQGVVKARPKNILFKRVAALVEPKDKTPKLVREIEAFRKTTYFKRYIDTIDINEGIITKRIAFNNGTLDISDNTFDFAPHSAERPARLYLDASVTKEFGETPRWKEACTKLLSQPGDTDDIRARKFEQFNRILSFIIFSPTNPKRRFFYFYGDGANGKTMVGNLIRNLLGEYAEDISVEDSKLRFNQFEFYGKIANISDEFRGRKVNTSISSKLRYYIARNDVFGDRRYLQPIVYNPRFKFVILSHLLPTFQDTSGLLQRRMELVLFPNKPSRADHDEFFAAFKEEKDSILSQWVAFLLEARSDVEGNWHEYPFGLPERYVQSWQQVAKSCNTRPSG